MITQTTLMVTAGHRVMAFLYRRGKSNQLAVFTALSTDPVGVIIYKTILINAFDSSDSLKSVWGC